MAYNGLTKRDAQYYSERMKAQQKEETISWVRSGHFLLGSIGLSLGLYIFGSPGVNTPQREIKLSERGRGMVEYTAKTEKDTRRWGRYTITAQVDSAITLIQPTTSNGVFVSGVRKEDGRVTLIAIDLEGTMREAESYLPGKPVSSAAFNLAFCNRFLERTREARKAPHLLDSPVFMQDCNLATRI